MTWGTALTGKVRRVVKEERGGRKNINIGIVSANNHYSGFGPETVNVFRKMVGLPEAIWGEEKYKLHLLGKQSSVSDFTT
jgi:hypothetical protein